ncbi:MAG TPA: FAD-dependent monooxygenase [Burkholderiaceae bacterium]|nr:FAD-dependent monooxygenase [Burkholderiaceae bacterium]
MPALPQQCDVLIVGAGPTGLMLANQLARHHIDALIIDRHAGPARETRALGVQARTMEIYAKLGVVEEALKIGKIGTGANMWARGRRTARIPLGKIGEGLTAYPYLFILGQNDNERLLGDKLKSLGREVQWRTELVGLTQQPDSVRAEIRMPDGSTQTISARYVAGCDGARSSVRELNKIEFPGAPYEHVFFVADVTMTGPMVHEEVNVFLLKDGFHLFFPMAGTDHWRLVGLLPPELRGRDDLKFDEVIPVLRAQAVQALNFQQCHWFSTYRIHHRRAAQFRVGRCFVLGDAAHIHSPVGAQGMNTGLQDAYNLGWKLALVVSGKASDKLLDTYAIEREPVAERLLQTTDRLFSFIVSDHWFSRMLRTRVLAHVPAIAMRFDRIRKFAFGTISQLGIRYPESPLSQTNPGLPDGSPRAGDRFPWMKLVFRSGLAAEDLFACLDDTRFNLILIGQLTTAVPNDRPYVVHPIPDLATNVAALARAGIRGPSYYLLRPDGHIGLAGVRLQDGDVQRYFSDRISS